jgi:hypothetical protein
LVEDLITTVTENFFNSSSPEETTTYISEQESLTFPSKGLTGTEGLDANTTMDMAPIYRIISSSDPGSITAAITGTDFSADPDNTNFKWSDEDNRDPEITASYRVDYVSGAIILAGSAYVLYNLNRAVRCLYKAACSYSDPRLLSLGYRPSRRSKAWAWTATVLEKVWPPLWFTSEALREEAVEASLDQIQRSRRVTNMLLRESSGEYTGSSGSENKENERPKVLYTTAPGSGKS